MNCCTTALLDMSFSVSSITYTDMTTQGPHHSSAAVNQLFQKVSRTVVTRRAMVQAVIQRDTSCVYSALLEALSALRAQHPSFDGSHCATHNTSTQAVGLAIKT